MKVKQTKFDKLVANLATAQQQHSEALKAFETTWAKYSDRTKCVLSTGLENRFIIQDLLNTRE